MDPEGPSLPGLASFTEITSSLADNEGLISSVKGGKGSISGVEVHLLKVERPLSQERQSLLRVRSSQPQWVSLPLLQDSIPYQLMPDLNCQHPIWLGLEFLLQFSQSYNEGFSLISYNLHSVAAGEKSLF